jgi:hypothetical protein
VLAALCAVFGAPLSESTLAELYWCTALEQYRRMPRHSRVCASHTAWQAAQSMLSLQTVGESANAVACKLEEMGLMGEGIVRCCVVCCCVLPCVLLCCCAAGCVAVLLAVCCCALLGAGCVLAACWLRAAVCCCVLLVHVISNGRPGCGILRGVTMVGTCRVLGPPVARRYGHEISEAGRNWQHLP